MKNHLNLRIMSKTEIYGYSIIAVFLPVLILLVFILWKMYRNGFSYGRKIPMPPERLRPKIYLYCFECEIETPIKQKKGILSCENCGLIHQNS